MFTIAESFCLKPGCYDEYKRAHDELWPDIAKSMAEHDVSMAIYLMASPGTGCGSTPDCRSGTPTWPR